MFLRAWATCLETGGGYPAHEGAGAACQRLTQGFLHRGKLHFSGFKSSPFDYLTGPFEQLKVHRFFVFPPSK